MKQWKIKQSDVASIDELSAKTGYSKIVTSIFLQKGLSTPNLIEKFVHPQIADLHNPFLFADMEKAVKRIRRAIENKEKILIYGDRDVDGITSTNIAYLYLKELSADVLWYIPSDEGYGLHNELIEKYKKEGVGLIITVDCGITAVEEVNLANSLGIDVIITDHHEPLAELPKAVAIIDPKCPSEKYPFRELAGCGVAFKLFQAVAFSYSDYYGKDTVIFDIKTTEQRKFIEEYLYLVALGTVADIVPLISENRILVKHGVPLFYSSKKPGIRAMIDNLQIEKKSFTTKKVSWSIVPLLNSAGRYGKAALSAELLVTDDKNRADELLEEILAINGERKNLQKINIKRFIDETVKQNDIENDKIFITVVSHLKHGVTGIAANQIIREFGKPVILLILEGEEAMGSARSISGFDIVSAIEKCKDIVVKYGGHKAAAGLTIDRKNLEEFIKRIKFVANSLITDEMLEPYLSIDTAIFVSDISVNLINELDVFEPCGSGNECPIFVVNEAVLSDFSSVGIDGAHLRVRFKNDQVGSPQVNKMGVGGIGWQLGRRAADFKKGQKVDVAFHLEINVWQSRESAQVMILDIKPSDNIL
ncbi:MAG: single-stranded-DNA-specific exonuclease RecJ [Elusimicrobiota bacterium]